MKFIKLNKWTVRFYCFLKSKMHNKICKREVELTVVHIRNVYSYTYTKPHMVLFLTHVV